MLSNKGSHCHEKPGHCNWRAAPACSKWREPEASNNDPAQVKKKDTEMAIKKHIKRFSIREMQIKTIMRYHFMTVRKSIIKKSTNRRRQWRQSIQPWPRLRLETFAARRRSC